MSPYQMKEMQYRAIAEAFEPVLFYTCPFYFEMGTMWAHCDGGRDFRGFRHAGGWTYDKNKHLFKDQDPELYALKKRQTEEIFYTFCGPYNDTMQHFNFDHRPILRVGLKGLYEQARTELERAENVV